MSNLALPNPSEPSPTSVGAGKTVMFSRGNFDLMSSYLAAYSVNLVNFAQQMGYTIINLYGDGDDFLRLPAITGTNITTMPDNLSNFETQIVTKPNLFIGACHGNKTEFVGQDLEVLLDDTVNKDDLNGIPTLLWACETGQQLGPDAVAAGCPLFLGYQADWTMLYDPDFQDTPLQDPYAMAFFDSGLAAGYALLLGQTPAQIYQATISRYNYWFDWWSKQNDPMADEILTWLNWDLTNFIAITPSGIQENAPTEGPTAISIPPILPVLGIAGALLLFLATQK